MSKKYLIGNWKMNLSFGEASLFVHRLDKEMTNHKDVEVAIAPTMLALATLHRDIDQKKIKLAAQNVHYADHGTFTGEVSAAMVKDYVDYAIVGHSDRRQKFHESNDDIARKMAACIRNGITPVLCVGEDLLTRQSEQTDFVIHDQVVSALAMLTDEDISKIIIAYEPIWALSSGDGHGEWAKPDIVAKTAKHILKTVGQLYGKKAEGNLRILYGGSSNPENLGSYLNLKEIDGCLVGGASMNYKSFAQMIEIAHKKSK